MKKGSRIQGVKGPSEESPAKPGHLNPGTLEPSNPLKIGNREKAVLHIAKSQLGLDDETYRDALEAHAGVRSAKDLDGKGYAKVLSHFVKCGFVMQARTRRPDFMKPVRRPGFASPGQIKKIYALWWTLSGTYYEKGKEFKALRAFLRARFRVDHENFLTPDKAHQVIEALKKIGVREKNGAKLRRNSLHTATASARTVCAGIPAAASRLEEVPCG